MSAPRPLHDSTRVAARLRVATATIAPVWPLESFVAVNPYFGMSGMRFDQVAARLARVAGARTTMPTRFYLDALAGDEVTEADVAAALSASPNVDAEPRAFLEAARAAADGAAGAAGAEAMLPTVADAVGARVGLDLAHLTVDRVSAFAAAHFDEGQAEWRPAAGAQQAGGLYAAWRAEALLDRTPEVMGVRGFRAAVRALPEAPLDAAREALARLEIPAAAEELYLHRLLMRVGGWSAFAARVVWDAKLYHEREDDTLVELAAVLLAWEAALFAALAERGAAEAWRAERPRLAASAEATEPADALLRDLVLHAAYETAAARRLREAFEGRPPASSPADGAAQGAPTIAPARPAAQAIFCIDVRSEVFRRHLEATAPEVETLGFAGFFAFPVSLRPLGHADSGAQCPVLLTPAHEVVEALPEPAAEARAVAGRRLAHEVGRAWKAFKMGAISCFSFVGPVGLAYLPKLFTDGFGLTRPVAHPALEGLDAGARSAKGVRLEEAAAEGRTTGIPLAARVELAEGALCAMSLTEGLARLVLVTGHGSTTVNNPHATGLDCGACGGRTGEANARVAAAVLNDPAVRAVLAERGLDLPADTVFVACQHDTTTDEVAVFDRAEVPATHHDELAALERQLAEAGRRARAERAARLALPAGAAVDPAVLARAKDWAQVRPEWGLAGCSAFVVAPRHRTEGLDLAGRSFLHSYAWREDEGFGVLELIMTAPMVVASWISLQYYASTVDNRLFGCGNKTLHNVVGTVGVFEGNAGDLRVGLPWQSVHDGEQLQHDPLKLQVVIEAPREAMNAIIEEHAHVRHLLDHGWVHLFAMDGQGRLGHRYAGEGRWEELGAQPAPQALAS